MKIKRDLPDFDTVALAVIWTCVTIAALLLIVAALVAIWTAPTITATGAMALTALLLIVVAFLISFAII